jgi:hypothetical protein
VTWARQHNKTQDPNDQTPHPQPLLKIVVVIVVGIACGALILRFIFEVGATQTSTNSRSQQWPGKSNKKSWLAGRAS